MAPANVESTTPAEGERSGRVSLDEALEHLLPHCEGKPSKVAARLDAQQREGDVLLLGGGVATSPASNPALLGIAAHNPPVGQPFLYVQVRQDLGEDCSPWDGKTIESLRRHHQFWTFERASFEAHFPGTPRNPGGRPREYVVEDLLIEALIYAGVAGGLPRTVEGEGSLYEKLKQRLGSRCPERVRFCEIFGPIFQRIKNERSR